MQRSHRSAIYRILAAGLACAAVFTIPPAGAGGRATKLERQIAVAQRTIDEMLVESPNFLVRNSEPTEGLEVEDAGVLFIFEASLTGPEWDFLGHSHRWSRLWRHDDRIVLIDRGDKKKEIILDGHRLVIKDGSVYLSDGDELRRLDEDEWEAQDDLEGQLEKYEAGKAEMIDALLDCGDILGALPAERWVRIEARLDDVELPDDREIHRLSVRAKLADLRSYSDGRLSEEEIRARVEIKES